MILDVAAIVLAGGKSSRMGCDKALLPLGKSTVIKVVIERLHDVCEDVLVVTSPERPYQNLNAQVVFDVMPDKNCLGGLYTGLLRSPRNVNFACACDMPMILPAVVRYLLEQIPGFDVVIPHAAGGYEPLCAVYTKACLPHIEQQLGENNLRMVDWLKHVRTRIVAEQELRKLDPELLSLCNLNTEDDYRNVFNFFNNV
jgi:molybdopterin-guanine dinucleotide biosynthesis protein A